MRLIDADRLQLRIDLHGTNKFGILDENIRDFIDEAPTVDAESVTRCKDCAFSQLDGWFCGGIGMMPEHPTFPDSFCEHGTRKDGDDHA